MTHDLARRSPLVIALSLLAFCLFGIALGSASGSTGFESWFTALRDDTAWQIVWNIRLPRSLGACAASCFARALGCAGARLVS